MADTLVIGIDSSTTACKAIAWDRSGRAVAEGRASYPLLQPEPTWYEQNAEQWWAGLCTALKELTDQIDVTRVAALGITHQRETFVPVDKEGRTIRNAILWLDERSRSQVTFLEQTIGRDRLHRISGKPPSMTPSLPKIVWLAQHEPDVVARTHKFLPGVAKPVQLGHELIATVEEVGEGVERFTPGHRVAIAHHVPDYSSHYSRRGSESMDPLFKRSNIDPGGFAEPVQYSDRRYSAHGHPHPHGRTGLGDPAKGEPMLAKIPLRRFGRPIEVADLVLFLASPASDLICGTIIMIDGGYTAV